MKESQSIEFKESWKDEYLAWICGFANAGGGNLYIGIEDDGTVCGIKNADKLAETLPQTIMHLLGIIVEINVHQKDELDYLEIIIERYPFPISYHGHYYLRSGTTNLKLKGLELDKFMLKKVGMTWDSLPNKSCIVEDLDPNAIKVFREKSLKSGRLTKTDLEVNDKLLLENLGLYEKGYLTNAAILLFHEHPERYVTSPSIKIGYFEDNHADLRYQDEINGPLMKQVDEAIDKIYSKYLKGFIWYDDIYRIEEFMFPREAFREILLNAVNHKDYSSGVSIQVSVCKNMIYVANISEFPKEIDFTKIYEKHISKPYNPKIAGTFFKSGMIESWGRGFEKIKDLCIKNNIPLPIVEINGNSIMIQILPGKKYLELLKREENKKNVTRNVTANDTVNDTVKLVLEQIVRNPKVTKPELSKILNKGVATISRTIQKLRNEGYIERIGSDKKGRWEIQNDTINDTVNDMVNDTVKLVLEQIIRNPKVTKPELSKILNKGVATISRAIKKLRNEGYIERIGSDKIGEWKIKNDTVGTENGTKNGTEKFQPL